MQRAGFDVALVDPGDARRGASFGNIGHIATEQVAPLASPSALVSFPARLFAFGGALDFRLRDAPMLAPWIARFMHACGRAQFARGSAALGALLRDPLEAWTRLAADVGHGDLIAPNGHAIVWMGEAAARAGRAAWMRTPTGAASFRDMEPEERAAYNSVLNAMPAGGLIFAGTGSVRSPQALRDAVLAAFEAAGGRRVAASVRALNERPENVSARLESGETIDADGVLVAAGAWSKPLMAGLGVRAPLMGERGYSIQSAHHAWPEALPTTVFEERSIVFTRFQNGLRASSFVEFGDPSAPADERKWRALQRSARALGVVFDAEPDRWCGPRPTLPDYLPAIGRLERNPRILYAFGHQHLGLTLAASTGDLIARLAQGAPPDIDLAPFRIERFSEPPR